MTVIIVVVLLLAAAVIFGRGRDLGLLYFGFNRPSSPRKP